MTRTVQIRPDRRSAYVHPIVADDWGSQIACSLLILKDELVHGRFQRIAHELHRTSG